MTSPLMKEQLSHHETAVQEVIRGYDLTTQLQSLLELRPPHGDGGSEVVRGLLDEVLQALSASLSILNSPDSTSGRYTTQQSGGEKAKPRPRNKGRKRDENSRTIVTSAPFADGHQWRKYGEKKIHGSNYPRCYYRCTHKDVQECPATKLVEQRDNEDPPMYLVTYNKEHSCKGIHLNAKLAMNSSPTKSSSLNFKVSTSGNKQENHHLSSSDKLENCEQMVDWHKNTCSTSNNPVALDVMGVEDPKFTKEYDNWDLLNTSLTTFLEEWDVNSLMADY